MTSINRETGIRLDESLYEHSLKYPKKELIFLRSSHPEMFCKNRVLRNLTTFTGKHLCQSLFFNKVAGLRPATLLKKRLWGKCFPVNFVKSLRTPFLIEHSWWLLLIPLNRFKFILRYFC